MSKHGGKRDGAGRNVGPDGPRKMYSVRLPIWLIEWLRSQDEPQSRVIETAIREHYGATSRQS